MFIKHVRICLKHDQTCLNDVHFAWVVDNFNFLGITINKHLNWDVHTTFVANKISRTIGILNKLKSYLPKHILCTIYNSLILCNLNYGNLVWGHNCKRLFKIQKKAVRVITQSKYISHTEPIFKELRLLKLEDIHKIIMLKFYHKLVNNKVPEYFTKMPLKSMNEIHQHFTRSQNSLIIPKVNHSFARFSISNSLAHCINNSPNIITEKAYTHSLSSYSIYIKNYFINQYQVSCNIPHCYVCQYDQ